MSLHKQKHSEIWKHFIDVNGYRILAQQELQENHFGDKHLQDTRFAIYLLHTLAKLKGDKEISTNTSISPTSNWSSD